MNKKNCIFLIIISFAFSPLLLTGSEDGPRRAKRHATKRPGGQIFFPSPNKKRKTINKEPEKKASEIITMLNAYFDALSLEKEDEKTAPYVDLIIPNLPVPIVVMNEEESIVDVKL